jgi:hypothetical protein
MGTGNRVRNIGYAETAKLRCYERARQIIDKNIRTRIPKAKVVNALERREMTVSPEVRSSDAEKLIQHATDSDERYGLLTAYQIVGYNDFRTKDYVRAEDRFRLMLDDQKRDAVISWWHKMAGWLGLGVMMYANDRSKFEEALCYCLMAEYVSAMLGLRVDVTKDVNNLLLLGPNEILNPSARRTKDCSGEKRPAGKDGRASTHRSY